MRAWTATELIEAADRYLANCIEQLEVPTVKGLAAMFHTTSDNFSHRFFRLVGVRPSEYLKRGQIERAKDLLKTTDLSMEQIAELCCFRETVTFFRAFKRITGMTPQQFRRMSRKTT